MLVRDNGSGADTRGVSLFGEILRLVVAGIGIRKRLRWSKAAGQ